MLKPNKNLKKAIGTGKKVVKSSVISQVLNKIPGADEIYDVANIFEGLREGDYQKIGSNFIGALLPGVSGKAFEAIAEDWLPPTPEIEKRKMQFNLKSSPAERQRFLKKYGSGYLNNPKFIKDQNLANTTKEKSIDLTKIKPKGKEVNLVVKETIPQNKGMVVKKKTKNTTPVSSDISTKALRTLFGALMPDQAAQFLSAITTKDNKLGFEDLTPDIKEALITSVKNAKKRTGKHSGGTQYIDYSPEVEQAFNGMKAGAEKMVSIDSATQAATMLGRVSYKKNSKGETEIYDSYDFSKSNIASKDAKTLYQKVRAYAGDVLPDEGKQPNLIGIIPEEELAFGTNQNGIMKTKMNPRKKYANGTNTQGVGPNNYIQSPNEVLNDYNIMLAETDKQVASNSVVPIVSLVGGLLQQGISMAGSFKKTPDADTASAANGMNNVNQNVEVEGGEMYETPQGETGEFQGPSHEQGGIPLEVGQDVEEGTKIYSDRLKVGKQTLAERKEARERKIANLEKVAAQPLIDSALKNATQRKMMAIQKEEMADLQFQEQINNMQQMADTMVKAFGTSMEGLQANPIGDSMRYGNGTGAMGVTEYGDGGTIGPIYGNEENKIKNLQSFLGVKPDGVLGKKTQTAWAKYQNPKADTTKNNYLYPWDTWKGKTPEEEQSIYTSIGLTPGGRQFKESVGLTPTGIVPSLTSEKLLQKSIQDSDMDIDQDGIRDGLANNPNINLDALKNFKIGEGINDNASLDYGDPYAKNGVNFKIPTETAMTPADQYGTGVNTSITSKVNPEGTMFSRGLEKGLGALNKSGGMPSIGDITGLFGNFLGARAGLKNAAESRSTDVTHTNVYQNAGKETQKQLDNAMSNIEGSKAQAIVRATATTQGGKRSGRNSARGVNQMRGMDWLYDTALNQQIADISANAAAQVSDIYKTKAATAMSVDQLKGQGEYQAAMANEAAKDAYYNAKGLGLKDQALGVQQIGKDLNAKKQNEMIEKLMKSGYGKWVGLDKNMNSVNKEDFKMINGVKYKKVE